MFVKWNMKQINTEVAEFFSHEELDGSEIYSSHFNALFYDIIDINYKFWYPLWLKVVNMHFSHWKHSNSLFYLFWWIHEIVLSVQRSTWVHSSGSRFSHVVLSITCFHFKPRYFYEIILSYCLNFSITKYFPLLHFL